MATTVTLLLLYRSEFSYKLEKEHIIFIGEIKGVFFFFKKKQVSVNFQSVMFQKHTSFVLIMFLKRTFQ